MLSATKIIGQEHYTEKIKALFTENKFHLVQVILFAIAMLLLFMLFRTSSLLNFFVRSVQYIIQSLKNIWQQSIHSPAKYFLIIPFLSSLFFAVKMPVSYDEACTWLLFTSRSPLASLCYYPSPNNHVLHSLITNFTALLPLLPVLFCLRVSSILAAMLSWMIAISFFKKYFSQNLSWLVAGLSSMLFMSIYYSYMSRGYGLSLLFFIISLYAAFKIIREGNQKKHWVVFAVSNTLGFFTMPSFLYPFLTISILIFLSHYKLTGRLIIYNTFTVFSTILLYTPIIAVNGLKALVGNEYVKPIPRSLVLEQMPGFFLGSLSEIFGFNFWPILALIIVATAVMALKRDIFQMKFYLSFLLMPSVLLFLHSVIPFPRTFYYYTPLLVFFILYPFKNIFEKLSSLVIIPVILLAQAALFYNFYSKINFYEYRSLTAKEINAKILNGKKYLIDSGLFDAYLRFELETKKQKAELKCYFPPVKMSADSIIGWDYVVIDRKIDVTGTKSKFIASDFVNVYTAK